MQSFEELNEQIVFTKVKSKNDALGLQSKAEEVANKGKSAVTFFENQYYLQLAPGQDPYQVRADIDQWVKLQEKKAQAAEEKKTRTTAKGLFSKKTVTKEDL